MTIRVFSRVIWLFFLPLAGCGDITPVWKDMCKLNNSTLYYSEPCEFTFEVTKGNPEFHGAIELAVTYYLGISRNNLPLFLVIEDKEHNVQEFPTNIILKENSQYLGKVQDNEIDVVIIHLAVPDVTLKNGSYSLKIYSNDDKDQKIFGVVQINVRMFEAEEKAS